VKFIETRYKIDLNNKSYIKAIATYNKAVTITEVNGSAVDCLAKDLLKLVDERRHTCYRGEMSIQGWSADSGSSTDVLPRLLKKSTPLTCGEQAKEIAGYFKCIDSQRKSGHDLGIPAPELTAMDATSAQQLVAELNDNNEITGAIHLPSCNAILLQQKSEVYCLRYGDVSVLYHPILTFDVDDGFGFTGSKEIADLLNKHFAAWKAKSYEGAPIADNAHGFTIPHLVSSATASAAVSIGDQKEIVPASLPAALVMSDQKEIAITPLYFSLDDWPASSLKLDKALELIDKKTINTFLIELKRNVGIADYDCLLMTNSFVKRINELDERLAKPCMLDRQAFQSIGDVVLIREHTSAIKIELRSSYNAILDSMKALVSDKPLVDKNQLIKDLIEKVEAYRLIYLASKIKLQAEQKPLDMNLAQIYDYIHYIPKVKSLDKQSESVLPSVQAMTQHSLFPPKKETSNNAVEQKPGVFSKLYAAFGSISG
jgi:hypothetical protein